MRFLFKTDYEDDIRLFPHSGYIVSYGVLLALLVIAPFVLSSYIVSQLVFVCIYATVGVGLMILTGFTGQAWSARWSDFRRCGCRAFTW
jgi:branched-chain amino acid transport system permease protein